MDIEFDMSNIKPNLLNLFVIWLAVMITVPFSKWFFNKVPVPGITSLVNTL